MTRLIAAAIIGALCAYALARRKPAPIAESGWRDWAPGADFV